MTTKERSVEEIVEESLNKLNKVYLRLAYGRSDIVKAKQEVNDILTQTLQAERQRREEAVEIGKRELVEYIDNIRNHDSCECDNCHRWRKFKRNWDKRCKNLINK